jgi:hypothetical protein
MKARTTPPGPPILGAVWTLFATLGRAATFISTLGQPITGGYQLCTTNTLNSNYASEFTTFGTGALITGLTVKLSNQDTVPRHVYGSIYANNAGQPGMLVGSFDPIALASGLSQTDVNLTSTGVSLAPNTTFWVGIGLVESLTANTVVWWANANNGTDAGSTFTTVSATNVYRSDNGGTAWVNYNPGKMLYSLSGSAAPEPSRIVLVMVGGCAVGVCPQLFDGVLPLPSHLSQRRPGVLVPVTGRSYSLSTHSPGIFSAGQVSTHGRP